MASEENPDKILVGCKVTREKSEEWDEFVEDSTEFTSKAQLIRAGVERIVEGDEESDVGMIRDDIDELMNEIERGRSEIIDLIEGLDDAEEIAEEMLYRLEEDIE